MRSHNIFVMREGKFEQEGRIHDEKQCEALDLWMWDYLKRKDIPFCVYDRQNVSKHAEHIRLDSENQTVVKMMNIKPKKLKKQER